MIITDIFIEERSLGLKTPFITAKRRLDVLKYYVVKICTDTGLVGIGGCSPTPVITGDTDGSIVYAINEHYAPLLMGREVTPDLLVFIQNALFRNTSPKAALDIAVYDLLAKEAETDILGYLGDGRRFVESDVTVSIGSGKKVIADIEKAIADGFKSIKIKLGRGFHEDMKRIREISDADLGDTTVRFDANQAWSRDEAVKIINAAYDLPLNIDLFEQPLDAFDLEGMAYVTKNTKIPILADESIFDVHDAKRVIEAGAADLINIKLMKCGGIYEAEKIYKAASDAGIKCVVGCMMEGPESVVAAAMFASSRGIELCDLDAPFLCSELPNGVRAEFKQGRINFL